MRKDFVNHIALVGLLLLTGCNTVPPTVPEVEGTHYIAHAGGTIEGYRYSNSLEAVREALRHHIDYIELDLCFTADSQLVAWHDWNWQWTYVPTHAQFMAHKVYDRFTPMDYPMIDSILTHNPQLSLVTDKISDPQTIDRYFHHYKQRVWVECFTDDDYLTLQQMGYHVLASRVPPAAPCAVSNYTFNRYDCADPSHLSGSCFAIYGGDISLSMADSIFALDERIHFVYTDNYD